MPTWIWIVLVAAEALVIFVLLLARHGLSKQQTAERSRADQAAADAARLPDALGRERQALSRVEQLTEELRKADASIASVNARHDTTVTSNSQLESDLKDLRGEHGRLRQELQDSLLNANSSTSALEAVKRDVVDLRDRFSTMETARDKALENLRNRGVNRPGF